jgi:hypothetical protein
VEPRFYISPQDFVCIKTSSNWKTMKDMARNIYIDLPSRPWRINQSINRSSPPGAIKYITDRKNTNGLAKVTFYGLKELEVFPEGFPLSCSPPEFRPEYNTITNKHEFGQSSCPNLSATTDLGTITDLDSDIGTATKPNENALQYYPLSAIERNNWGVLTGRVDGRDDNLVAFVWSSGGGTMPGEYELQFRPEKVRTRNFIVRTKDLAVIC